MVIAPISVTDLGLDWLKNKRDPNKPFMLMCQHKAPHRNWAPAERHFKLFPDDVPEPDTLRDDYAGRSELLKENEMSIRNDMHWGHDMKFRGNNLFPEHFADRHGNGELQKDDPCPRKKRGTRTTSPRIKRSSKRCKQANFLTTRF